MSRILFQLHVPTQEVVAHAATTDDAWFRIRRIFSGESDHVQLIGDSKFQVPLWLFLSKRESLAYRLDSEEIDFRLDAKLSDVLARTITQTAEYERLSKAETLSVATLEEKLKTAGFSRRLKAYQSRNVRHLLRHSSGATFSVPGAGKTTEGLAYFLVSATSKERLLVIAPKNAFAAWETQLDVCVPKGRQHFVRLKGGRTQIAASLSTNPRFLIISYRQLQTVMHDVLAFMARHSVTVFLDESHRMKGGLARETGRAVLRLSGLPARKLLLSGTPMPNSAIDLVAQVQFLYPSKQIDEHNAQQTIRPIYVRTTKDELGLRRPDRILREIEMSAAQKRLYALIAQEEARKASRLKLRDRIQLRQIGRSVIRLIQAASNPVLLARNAGLPEEILKAIINEGDSAKIEYACERARLLARRGRKVVIWSTFIDTVELIASRLRDIGADYIHGGVDAGSDLEEETRERKIKDFHLDDRKFVLVASPASCGEGISLHEVCHHAIYIDRNFNAGQYLQSEDRIHRLGLAKNQRTVIELLASPGTIDRVVQGRLATKVRAMALALNDKGLHIDPVSLDPEALSDDEAVDEADARAIVKHLAAYA